MGDVLCQFWCRSQRGLDEARALYAKRAGNGGNTIVCMRGGFHGRTLETIAATMQDWLQDSFRPLPGGFVACTPNDVDELRAIFKQLGSEICAVMLEPIQGESGVHPMTEEFMAAARDLAHEVGAVLIATRSSAASSAPASRLHSKPMAWSPTS